MSSFLPQLGFPKPPLRDQVYAILKEAILSGKFKPGDRMMEQEIARSMGLSRSPVREAFRRLEQEGYLQATRSGIVVQSISFTDVQDLYFLRERLEGIAAALAATRAADDNIQELHDALPATERILLEEGNAQVLSALKDFHTRLYALSCNKYLIETLTALYEQVYRLSSLNVTHHHRGRAVLEEHRAIVEAIARHSPIEAEGLAREHVLHAWENAQKSLAPRGSS